MVVQFILQLGKCGSSCVRCWRLGCCKSVESADKWNYLWICHWYSCICQNAAVTSLNICWNNVQPETDSQQWLYGNACITTTLHGLNWPADNGRYRFTVSLRYRWLMARGIGFFFKIHNEFWFTFLQPNIYFNLWLHCWGNCMAICFDKHRAWWSWDGSAAASSLKVDQGSVTAQVGVEDHEELAQRKLGQCLLHYVVRPSSYFVAFHKTWLVYPCELANKWLTAHTSDKSLKIGLSWHLLWTNLVRRVV